MEDEGELVLSFKASSSGISTDLDNETPTTQDARRYIRDFLLDEFNRAQPDLDLDTPFPSLAVIPVNTSMLIPSDRHTTEDVVESIKDHQLYAVGIHPRRAWKLMGELDAWRTEHTKGISDSVFDDAIERLVGKFSNIGGFNIAELIPGYRPSLRQTLNFYLNEYDPDSDQSKESVIQGLSRGVLHHDPMEAGRVLQSVRNGQVEPDLKSRVETNHNILMAISSAANRSMDDIGNTTHPVLWMCSTLVSEFSRRPLTVAQQLAAMGIDLSVDVMLAGEIAEMNGARLVSSNREVAALGTTTENGSVEQRIVGEAYTVELDVNGEPRYATLGIELSSDTPELKSLGAQAYEGRAVYGYKEPATGSQGSDEARSRKHKRAAFGRILAAYSVNELPIQAMPKDVPINDMGSIPVSWSSIPYLGLLGSKKPSDGLNDVVSFHTLSSGEKAAEPGSQNVQWVQALNDAVTRSQQALIHSTSEARNNPGNRQLLREAIEFWVSTHFGETGSRAIEAITDDAFTKLVNQDAEMICVSVKNSARSIRYYTLPVSYRDIQKADFNRFQAAEKAVYEWSRRHPTASKRNKSRTFDALSALKPQALSALNEVKKQSADPAGDSRVAKHGRQNTGLVYGLSVKDLRGSRHEVLDRIAGSDPVERKGMITKTRLWQTPDWVGVRSPEDGTTPMEPLVACFWNELRKQSPSKPPADLPELNKPFATAMLLYRDWFDQIRTDDDLLNAIQGEFLDSLEGIFSELKELDIPARQILGSKFRFVETASGGLTKIYNLAKLQSRDNVDWPSSVGRKRAANNSGSGAQEKFGAMPMLEKIQRLEGEDHRHERDVTELDLLQTFGFSGIEYGESMPQRERTMYLNHAYDAFMDMARALDVQPQTLSMGGTLGLAFGSRGRGGRNAALAHFEPGNNVINLTRMKGAGSLAHEMGHTIANYFSRQVTGQSRGPGDLSEMVAMQQPMGFLKSEQIGRLRKTVYDAFTTIMANICYEPVDDMESNDPSDKIALGRFTLTPILRSSDRRANKDATTFFNEAVRADFRDSKKGSKSRIERYWSDPKELFARAFETWIHKRLSDMQPGFRNDYLVRPDKFDAWGASGLSVSKGPQLYPAGEHLDRLDYAFRNLFEVVETGYAEIDHEHLGKTEMPYLYSHDESVSRIQPADRRAFAECAIQEIARMCGPDVLVSVKSEITDPNGNPVGGRFRAIGQEYRNDVSGIRALLEITSNGPFSNIYHEAFHFAQAFLITEKEQEMLDNAFSKGEMLYDRLAAALVEDNREYLIDHCDNPREAQAYAYQQWVKGNLDLSDSKPARTVFEQVQRWCRQVSSTPDKYGFESTEVLFQNFYDGRLALREQQSFFTNQAMPVNQVEHTYDQNTPGTEGESDELKVEADDNFPEVEADNPGMTIG
ncbi:LPD1 domain-containing protein [Marinobacter halodurans]|uniref:LPD1 domain-containing protein n=1 Tax=Marinobacter halodurans TaxID=2528979 RepID=UPI001A9550E1|nr:LPD1 domain-containing protein [Marinobacter halodurans]